MMNRFFSRFVFILVLISAWPLTCLPAETPASASPSQGQLPPKPSFGQIDREARQADQAIGVLAPAGARAVMDSQIVLALSIPTDVTEQGIMAYQFRLVFDPSVLQVVGISTSGTMSHGWTVYENMGTQGQISVVGYSARELTGSGVMLDLIFDVIGAVGDTTLISFAEFSFNEGDPDAVPVDGDLLIIPASPEELAITHSELEGIDLTWSHPNASMVDHYEVWRSINTPYFDPMDVDCHCMLVTSTNSTSYTDSAPELIGDTTQNYFYAVRAVIAGVESDFSARCGEFDFGLVLGE